MYPLCIVIMKSHKDSHQISSSYSYRACSVVWKSTLMGSITYLALVVGLMTVLHKIGIRMPTETMTWSRGSVTKGGRITRRTCHRLRTIPLVIGNPHGLPCHGFLFNSLPDQPLCTCQRSAPLLDIHENNLYLILFIIGNPGQAIEDDIIHRRSDKPCICRS